MSNTSCSKKDVIESFIISEIENETLNIGDQIPTERELIDKFSFSRQTIHQALMNLAIKGIINRILGKGSYVASKPVKRNIQQKMSFTEDMKSVGMQPGSKIIEYKILQGKDIPVISKELGIKMDEYVHYCLRIRTGNDIPVALQYSYIPAKFYPNLDINVFNNSIDEYASKEGYKIIGFTTRLKAVEGTSYQCKLLNIEETALLKSISTRYIDKNIPFQLTISFYRSDIYEYSFSSMSLK